MFGILFLSAQYFLKVLVSSEEFGHYNNIKQLPPLNLVSEILIYERQISI